MMKSSGVDTSKGMSPRKAMASEKSPGNFGVETVLKGTPHPDVQSASRGEMADNSRGVGMPVGGSKSMMPAQGAPDHGPHYVGGMGAGWDREGRS